MMQPQEPTQPAQIAQVAVLQRAPLWARVQGYIDWRANPVLVKDLRLWMRGRGFILQYFLLIAAIVTGSALYTIAARTDHFDGRDLWSILYGGVLVICGAVVPHLVYERFRQELKNKATELAMLSELSARRVVRGKLFSAWCASLLVLSAAAPAFATAYLLGGIDFLAALFYLFWLLAVALLVPCLQLMLAAMGQNAPVRLLAGLVVIGQIIGAIALAVAFHQVFMRGTSSTDGDVFIVSVFLFFCAALFANYFYQIAVSRLRGISENREFSPRLSLSLASIGCGISLFLMIALTKAGFEWEMVWFAALAMSLIFSIGFLFVCGTNEELPPRLRAGWRAPGLLRLILYPGLDRLCAYVLFNFLVIIVPTFVPLFFGQMWKVDSYTLIIVPYILIGGGLAFHRFVMLPVGERTGWWPSELATIIGVNVVVAVLAALAAVLAYASDTASGWKMAALSFSPIDSMGLASGGLRHLDKVTEKMIMTIWLGEAGLVTVFLLIAAFSAWREGLRIAASFRQNSQYRVVK